MIKNSRKLYYITDWVTDTDDLTLEKLEKELGVTCGSLVDGSATTSRGTATTYIASTNEEVDDSRYLRGMVQGLADHAMYLQDQLSYSTRPGRSSFWGNT